VAQADDLLGKVLRLEAEAHRIKDMALKRRDLRTALQGIWEATRTAAC